MLISNKLLNTRNMKALINSVNLIGNLGKDVEVINFDNGGKKANVSLATSHKFTNAKGETQTRTQWHNLVAWGKNAELMKRALSKGAKVAVSGSIMYRNYEDKSGIKRNVTEILVADFIKMTSASVKPEIAAPAPF